jgi:Gnt-I system low-affinity gluconate transporter
METTMATSTLVITSVGSVLLLLFLVMKARMHAFIALMLVSVGAGLFAGMPLEKITETMQKGMAGTLGFLAIVVALGAMFGKILHETGALDQIANKLLKVFGVEKAHYALGLAGLICALPLFFDVAIVLLIGMVFAVTRRTGGNVVKMAVPLFAGVAAAAAFLLPGPTPMLVASQMGADYGWMIAIGLAAAIPGMLLAGPLFGNFISKHVHIGLPAEEHEPSLDKDKLPSFGFSLALVLFPLFLVGLNTIGTKIISETASFSIGENVYSWHSVFKLIGHPFIAILAACLLAMYGLAIRRGMSKEKVMEICSAAIQPAGIILLVTGAGGVFKQVLVDSKVGPALGDMLIDAGLPIAVACFVLSAAVRVIQGSATVACLTTVGLVLPVISTLGFNGAQLAALAVCISGGSIVLSHVNDSGFWLFGKFTGATEAQTLKTWTLMETILGTTGAIVGMIAFSVL